MMDVKIKETQKKQTHKVKKMMLAGICSLGLIGWMSVQPSAASKVQRADIWTGQVQKGDLVVQVQGYGKLKSKIQRLLTAPTNSTVDEIILKPGAIVNAQSILLRLTDPEIEQQVKDAHRELDTRNTNYRRMVINQKREALSHQAQLEQLLSNLEVAQLNVEAETPLVAKGIVSKIDFKGTKLNERQLTRRLKIEKERLVQLAQLHEENLAIAKDQIEQQQEQVNVINTKFENLTVRAGIDGVLQSLPVELGQSVSFGQQLALVGSMDNLIANLTIPQSQMQQVQNNQKVSIDTRGGMIDGVVSRIDPVVVQGSIQVEVALLSALPKNARPELNINGTIFTHNLSDVFYVKKPINAVPGSNGKLFKIHSDKDLAEAVNVSYGKETNEYIQIITGANSGDSFILSDMSRWQDVPQITIID